MESLDLQKEYLEAYAKTDKRLALLEQQITTIKDNHLSHLESDVRGINRKFNWAVGVLFVQLLGIISFLVFKM